MFTKSNREKNYLV